MPAPVTSLNLRTDGGWDVGTEHGTIKAKQVVNAAGTCSLIGMYRFCLEGFFICPQRNGYYMGHNFCAPQWQSKQCVANFLLDVQCVQCKFFCRVTI